MKRIKVNVDELLKHSLPSASREQSESATARVLRRLQSNNADTLTNVVADFAPTRPFGRRWFTATVAAAAVIIAIWLGVGHQHHRIFAEPAEGLLYRGSEGNTDYYRGGEQIEMGATVHTNDYSSAAFTLPDGSRVEMRSKSELTLEGVKDGVRIHLNKGAVVVDAASQPAGGRLSVQTNSVTASALASGFLINVEKPGTRVAAIWGVIRVEQGDRVTILQPGEQIGTGPSMNPVSLIEEIEWSRNSSTYIHQLKQAAGMEPVASRQNDPAKPITQQPSAVVHTGEQAQTDIEPEAIRRSIPEGSRSNPATFQDKWAEGKNILARSCSSCHSVDSVYRQILAGRAQQRYTARTEYESLIATENDRGAGLSELEAAQLADWLTNFSGFK